jgi:PAS domain S-box-containing protein
MRREAVRLRDRRGLLFASAIIAATIGLAALVVFTVIHLYTASTQQRDLTTLAKVQAKALEQILAAKGVTPAVDEFSEEFKVLLTDAASAYSDAFADSRLYVGWAVDDGYSYTAPSEFDSAPAGESALDPGLQRALAGESGAIRITGQNAMPVLLAFAPVSGTKAGLILTQPFIPMGARLANSALWLAGAASLLISIGCLSYVGLRRRMSRDLQERDTRFRGLFESVRSGAVTFKAADAGEDFVITDFNRGAEWIEGLDRSAVIGKTLTEALPQYKSFGLLHVLRRVWRSGKAEHVPTTFYLAGRTSGWREAYVYRQGPDEVVALYDDVSPRKRLEESLRESEAHWRMIVEMQAVGVVLVNNRHEISFANRAAQNMFGKPSHQLIGSPFGLPLAYGNATEIEIARTGGEIVIVEMRTGTMRWLGEEHTVVFLTDVSAYKRAQGDLRKLFQAIEQSPASVVITDTKGNIEYVNPKFCDVSGYAYSEVIGRNPRILKSDHLSSEAYRDLWRTIANSDVWRGEFRNQHKDGSVFWELASIAPVRDNKSKITHYVAVKEDITERRATEERLRAAQRMETIGQLTGGIAHDFNNLLGIILGNLQLLDEIVVDNDEAKELIADALWSAERGGDLTHRLLAFARRQRLNPKATDVNIVVSEMAELLRRTLGERIEIQEKLSKGLWASMIDRGQLESALLNLVVNARDAMPDGGRVTIQTQNVDIAPPEVPSTAETTPDTTPGSYVMLSVSDTGTGMAPGVVDKIFEPFFTTKKFGHGSGLGLSMVYGFVRQSGGFIDVDSKEGVGTSLHLYIPKAVPELARQHSSSAPPSNTHHTLDPS